MISQQDILSIIEQQTGWAVGCTEPVMVALAVARAADLAGGAPPLKVLVEASPGIFKNVRSVGLPGTSQKGVSMAAALGAAGVEWKANLCLFESLTPAQVRYARDLLEAKKVTARCDHEKSGLYVRAVVENTRHSGEAVIEGSHNNFTRLVKDGQVLLGDGGKASAVAQQPGVNDLKGVPYLDFIELILSLPLTDPRVQRLVEGSQKARALAEEVISGGVCCLQKLGIPDTLQIMLKEGSLTDSLLDKIRLEVAAAVAARMSGLQSPVMASGGSGNQGLMIGITIGRICEAYGVGQEDLGRALLLAHGTNIYLKAYTGIISPLCGAVAAGAGVAAASGWLSGMSSEEMGTAVENLISNLYGMICDGAKASCALKMATGAVEGVIAGSLAKNGVYFRSEGIVADMVDQTISQVEQLTKKSYHNLDKLLLAAEADT